LLRSCFVPLDVNSVLLVADYNQIELRLLAHWSKDKLLIDMFRGNVDVHKLTASKIFDVLVNEVSESERSIGKTTNYALLYGVTKYGLMRDLGVTDFKAVEILDSFKVDFPMLSSWIEKVKAIGLKYDSVFTRGGRRIWISNLSVMNSFNKAVIERQAVNFVIQGSGADILKKAMVLVVEAFKVRGLKSRLLMSVHDELIFSVPNDEVEVVKPLVKDIMENVFKLHVPLVVDIGVGLNWFDAKSI